MKHAPKIGLATATLLPVAVAAVACDSGGEVDISPTPTASRKVENAYRAGCRTINCPETGDWRQNMSVV